MCVRGRGLFEKDKLVFSFMLCIEVMKISETVLPDDWNYFLRGATGAQVDLPPKPDVSWLQPWQWLEACRLDTVLPAFKGIKADMVTTPCWVAFGDNNVVSRLRRYFHIRQMAPAFFSVKNFPPSFHFSLLKAKDRKTVT